MVNLRFLGILVIFPIICFGQTKSVDSLLNILETTPAGNRYELLMLLATEMKIQQPNKALRFSKEARLEATKSIDNLKVYKTYYFDGVTYSYCGKYDSSIFAYNKALELSLELQNLESTTKSYIKIAKCYFNLGNYDLSHDYFQKALELTREEGDQKREASVLSELGYIYKTKGDFDKAIQFYNRSINISNRIGNRYNSSLVTNRIGSIYSTNEDYPKALEYYEKALKMREQINDTIGIAGSYNNIAGIYQFMGKYDTAIYLYQQALQMNIRNGYKKWQSFNLNNIGNTYQKQGKYDKALEFFFQSLKIKESIGNRKGIVWTYSNISEVYLKQEEYQKAIYYSINSLKLSKEIGLKKQVLESYNILSTIYSTIGDYENAFIYSQEYNALKDSVYNKEKIEIITEIQTRYETENKEKENEVLKLEAGSRKNLQAILFIVIASLVILSVLLFFMFRYKHKSLRNSKSLFKEQKKFNKLVLKNKETEKQHLEELVYAEQKINSLQHDKIQNKNRELSTTTLHGLNKNKILSEIKRDITQICRKEYPESKSLKEIVDLIDSNIALDQDWDQFKKHFETVHKGFFQNLKKKHPALSTNDLKLCAYLKIGMSTKEIARVMIVTVAAIKKNRQRLRKKLELENEEDLMGFFNKF